MPAIRHTETPVDADKTLEHDKPNVKVSNAKNEKKHHVGVLIEKNAFVDEGSGLVSFPNKLVITDNTEQRNGTRYDIGSMDLSEYKGQLTADHVDMLQAVIGKVRDVSKIGTQVVVDAVQFAVKESALGRLAYNLFKGGFITDFSIETYGPPPDEEGVYHDARLCGLSAVVVGNNRNATINKIVTNSIAQAKEDGLDVTEVEKNFLTKFTINQTHVDDNPEPEEAEVETETAGTKQAEVPTKPDEVEAAKEIITKEETDMSKEKVEEAEKQEEVKVEVEEVKVEKVENATPAFNMESFLDAIDKKLDERLKPLSDKVDAVEQHSFDAKAKEPEFKKDENAQPADARHANGKSALKAMGWQDRHGKQIQAAWDMLKRNDFSQYETLSNINQVNLEMLKEKGKVKNTLTLADFGNFVISPELLTEIEGCRNNYTSLVNATQWKETLQTQFAWLRRSGDISMSPVDMCDDGTNGNLKPISEYSATLETSNLEELAAVTPVCNAATRFMAADLLGDVAAGYRNDYDRGRAKLVVARLEQAVESNGNSVIYDVNPAVGGLTAWIDTWAQIATCSPNGSYVFNTSTFAEVQKRAVESGANGPLANIFVQGSAALPTIFGHPFLVVPDDLMPTLNSAGTVTVAVDGVNVTINHAVFYANLDNFTGRTSGGLQYDLSTEAAYEDNGTVKSAYQRNELVLRGSYFRGGAIKDEDQVAGLLSPGVS